MSVVRPARLMAVLTATREFARFGSVGAVAFVITVGAGNALHGGLGLGPLTSNGLATVAATTFAYAANRAWTFRHRGRTGLRREYGLFFGLNAIGLLITELFIGLTHYTFGRHGAIAYNVALVLGTGAATVFRYWSYKKWVFRPAEEFTIEPEPAAFEPIEGERVPSR